MSAATWGVYHATSGSESPPRVPPPFLPSVLRAVGQDPDPFPLVERPYVFVLQCNDAVVAVFESEQAAERVARKLNSVAPKYNMYWRVREHINNDEKEALAAGRALMGLKP